MTQSSEQQEPSRLTAFAQHAYCQHLATLLLPCTFTSPLLASFGATMKSFKGHLSGLQSIGRKRKNPQEDNTTLDLEQPAPSSEQSIPPPATLLAARTPLATATSTVNLQVLQSPNRLQQDLSSPTSGSECLCTTSDDESSVQNTPPAASAAAGSLCQQMPNWITTEEGQGIFVTIMAYARGANGDYSQSLAHGQRQRFFNNLAQTQFLEGGLFEGYAPISPTFLQRRFAEATQFVKSHFDLQGTHSADDNNEGTWPQYAVLYIDYLQWHDNRNDNESKQRRELMAIQRSIIGQQHALGRGPAIRPTTNNMARNDLGDNTQVRVANCPNLGQEGRTIHGRIEARNLDTVRRHHHRRPGAQDVPRAQQQRQNVNGNPGALRLERITAIASPLLEQICKLNSHLTMSLAGSQLRSITAIRQDFHNVLRERQEAEDSMDRVGRQILDEQLHLLQQELEDRRSFDHMMLTHCQENKNTFGHNNQEDHLNDPQP